MRIEIRESVAAPAEMIFNLSQDYATRLSWDPFLRQAILLGDAASAGLGVRSLCVSRFGVGMESEYISYNPPKVAAVKMTNGPWMFEYFAASWNFRATGPGRTEVEFVYSFQIRKPIRLLMPLIAAFLKYEMVRRLACLRTACEAYNKG